MNVLEVRFCSGVNYFNLKSVGRLLMVESLEKLHSIVGSAVYVSVSEESIGGTGTCSRYGILIKLQVISKGIKMS